MSTIEEAIVKLDTKLMGIPFEFAFLGGSVLTLLVTDKSADAIRVTKDVDIHAVKPKTGGLADVRQRFFVGVAA